MSQKLGALFHEEVTALCTLTSEFHYLVVYFLPNASNASYGYGFCQHSEIVSPFPVMNVRRGNQFKFGGNGKFQTDCVPYSIILKNNTFLLFFRNQYGEIQDKKLSFCCSLYLFWISCLLFHSQTRRDDKVQSFKKHVDLKWVLRFFFWHLGQLQFFQLYETNSTNITSIHELTTSVPH